MNQMLANFASSHTASRQRLIDILVVAAMGLVAIALSFALNLHFGLSPARSIVAGVMICALLVGAHFMIVPREAGKADVSELENEELWRALKEQRRDGPDATRIAMATRTEAAADDNPGTPPAAEPASAEGQAHVPRRKPRIRRPEVPSAQAGSDPQQTARQLQDDIATAPGMQPAEAVSDADDFWSYRPQEGEDGDPQLPSPEDPRQAVVMAQAGPPPKGPKVNTAPVPTSAETPPAKAPRESDVELVQSMIKKLAHQVNASDVLAKSGGDVPADTGTGQGDAAAPQLAQRSAEPPSPQSAVTPPPLPAAPEAAQSVDLVGASVDVLRTTADAMREADAAAPDGAPSVDQPLRPATPPGGVARASELMSALTAGQYGVLLEPILTLDGLHADHYEVHLQINCAAGSHLEKETVERDLQATGVLAAVDQQRFAKTVNVGELLLSRGKAGDVLTRIYRESLADRDFCYAVASRGVGNETLAQHLVLTLSQEAVRALTASEWQTLVEFRELGYRFALSDVRDIDMDFEQLTAVGFTFVKLRADLFLNGGTETQGSISPHELARYFAGIGLSVIVDGVDDAQMARDVAASGAILGQGAVSGGPRLMRADAVADANPAVA